MNEIQVRYGALETLAGDCAATAKYLDNTLDALRVDVTGLLGTWEGEAKEAYQQLQDKWDESARQLKQVLAQIGTAVTRSSENYQARERSNRDEFMQ